MEMHEMDKYMEQIERYAVRLYDSVEAGSGFLFVPQGSDSVYIFTALHVVINTLTGIGKDLAVDWGESHFVCKGAELEYCTLYQELDEGYIAQKTGEELRKIVNKIDREVRDSENPERNKDIAVLRVPKGKFEAGSVFAEGLCCIGEERLPSDFQFMGAGFPNGKDYRLMLKGHSIRWNKIKRLRDCQALGMEQEFVERMRGFSGTGLVTDYRGKLIFIGIVVSCDSNEKHQCFRAVGTSEILSGMERKGWELPDIFGKGVAPDDFLEKVSYFREDLKYMDTLVRRGLKNAFMEIARDNQPGKLAETEKFYDIPKCTGERISCPVYWKGRFWLIYIYRVIGNPAGADHCVIIDGQELKMKYICTEGSGKAEISTVVASAIRQNIFGPEIKGDCILVWQSEENPDRHIFSKRRFKNVVEDIADGNMYGMNYKLEKEGYDLLAGEMKTKNYGIFHIKYLLEQLEKCHTMDEVGDKIRGILEDVWK